VNQLLVFVRLHYLVAPRLGPNEDWRDSIHTLISVQAGFPVRVLEILVLIYHQRKLARVLWTAAGATDSSAKEPFSPAWRRSKERVVVPRAERRNCLVAVSTRFRFLVVLCRDGTRISDPRVGLFI